MKDFEISNRESGISVEFNREKNGYEYQQIVFVGETEKHDVILAKNYDDSGMLTWVELMILEKEEDEES